MKFKRQCFALRKRLKDKWRKPKGRQSKQRISKGGSAPQPNPGYGTKKEGRGLVREKKPVWISNPDELSEIGKENIIIVKSSVGKKKGKKIKEKAAEKGLEVFN